MSRPKIAVLSSGTETSGGSSLEEFILDSKVGKLDAEIVAVICNHSDGGVRQKANKYEIPFHLFNGPWTAGRYQLIAKHTGAQWFVLLDWFRFVDGLNLNTAFNSKTVFGIYPGPLAEFDKPGLYGQHVHAAVMMAFRKGEISHTAVSMYFVTSECGRGPVFFEQKIKIKDDDTLQTMSQRAGHYKRFWQPQITNLVVNDQIKWDGVHPESLRCPEGYEITRFENEV